MKGVRVHLLFGVLKSVGPFGRRTQTLDKIVKLHTQKNSKRTVLTVQDLMLTCKLAALLGVLSNIVPLPLVACIRPLWKWRPSSAIQDSGVGKLAEIEIKQTS